MAGRGPAPKPKDQRRNRSVPQRGEWVDLPAVVEPVLPELPKRPRGLGRWSPRTVAAWDAWRMDPATTQYGPAEVASALELAFLHHDAVNGDEKWSEVRQWMDRLGLNAKGKRDLRWRAPSEHAADAGGAPALRAAGGTVHRLRAVDPSNQAS
jgi:hypothetical protein